MLECIDEADRSRCALTLLLQSTECCAGSLFAVRGRLEVSLLAALPEQNDDQGLQRWLEAYLEAEQRSDVTASFIEEADTNELDDQSAYTDEEGRRFEVTALVAEQRGEPRIVGLLALQIGAGLHMRPPQQLCQEIAESMLEQGDLG
jgi:hypothetical protein